MSIKCLRLEQEGHQTLLDSLISPKLMKKELIREFHLESPQLAKKTKYVSYPCGHIVPDAVN